MKPSVRLAALMKLKNFYIWTHDSIGVGEEYIADIEKYEANVTSKRC
jgi:hypothetical protein